MGDLGARVQGILLDLVQSVLGVTSGEGYRAVAHGVVDLFGAEGAALFLCDMEERSLFPVAVVARGESAPIVEERIALRMSKHGTLYRALGSTTPVHLEEGAPGRGETAVALSLAGPVSMLPLSHKGMPLGLLLLAFPAGRQRPSDDELGVLMTHLGWALGRATEFEDVKRSEKKYRALAEQASDLVFALDAVGRITYLNSRVKDVLGYEPGELVGRFVSSLLSPGSWEESLQVLRRALSEGKKRIFCRWEAQKRRGGTVILDVHSSILLRDSRYVGQQGIARDNTEINRMEEELERSHQTQMALKDYIALVTRVQEEERRRIARELHDDTVQSLTAISRGLDICVDQDDRSEMERKAQELRGMADQALASLRRFIRDLRPAVLDDLGLRAALEGAVSEVRRRGLEAHLDVRGVERRLAPEAEVALFRIAQEAVGNATRHAQCQSIQVCLEFQGSGVTLCVRDDGRGFEVPGDVSCLAKTGCLGLLGMRERLDLVQGSLEVSSSPGGGTRVVARVPEPVF
jgi:PAS domain S-box-containing protein